MSLFSSNTFHGQVVLVTGGGTGIGKQIARSFGRCGASLAICSRRLEVIEATAAEFEGEGLSCLAVPCDVRKPDEVEHVLRCVIERYGRLDVVINNAAGNFPAPMSGITYNGFKAVVDIDLLGTYNVSKAAFETWLGEHGGNIVNITAPFQNVGPTLQAHVASAKAGVDSLTRTCAVEWGPRGIRVNAVAPGAIADTEGLSRFENATEGGSSGRCPLGRVGTAQDIADTVLFLASEASTYVTGQIICVDGGSSVDSMKIRLD
ncbi:SDR family oxidoreductase [Myxococcota bacterium]|nr:SDR family oxidoreductase [Myxococcota bacterium]